MLSRPNSPVTQSEALAGTVAFRSKADVRHADAIILQYAIPPDNYL